ncbi:hypothetical protein [Neisseria lactamica]|uniref:hypothetical protein n=1 Tax=Neisseria lactamica TaxID=486 RepID=UPI0002F29207|nr:hypothetical protein [Neisseria lactamica]
MGKSRNTRNKQEAVIKTKDTRPVKIERKGEAGKRIIARRRPPDCQTPPFPAATHAPPAMSAILIGGVSALPSAKGLMI